MRPLEGKVAVVTGASRGVGKGIAVGLGESGATVYVTGRTDENYLPDFLPQFIKDTTIQKTAEEINKVGGIGIAHRCDHRNDEEVKALFDRVINEQGKVDILVNNVWAGYEHVPRGYFYGTPFWKQPLSLWDDSFDVGLRSHYVASWFAAQSMVIHRNGLIINISFYAGRRYMINVTYGVCKAALDRLSRDMAYELKEYGIPVFSLYPGLVRTEAILEAAKYDHNLILEDSESPQFIGRCIAALAQDKSCINRTGEILISAEIAQEYNIMDIDGRIPKSHRNELW